MTQNLLGTATVLALLSVVVFIGTYAIRARTGWWRDPLGRMLMLGGLAVGGLAAVGTVRRIDSRLDCIDLAHVLNIGSVVAYLLVAAVWGYKTWTVLRETRRGGP